MKNIRKLLILLFISLLVPTTMISQNTLNTTQDSMIVLTPRQAKITNIIFAEHNKWSKEIPILNNEINSYKKLINTYINEDSLKSKQIDLLKTENYSNINNIKKLNKKLKFTKITGISGSFLLFLLGIFIAK